MITAWYLRSTADQDTHRGTLRPDGAVAARCGVQFAPLSLPFDRLALPGHPEDADQVCPDCAKAAP